jgi:drug/metabolite transporter (DMT)-like permease
VQGSRSRLGALTCAALLFFAANSLLSRLGLTAPGTDPASFVALRLASGALTLHLLVRLRRGPVAGQGGWQAAFWLFVYAAPFSFAYVSLDTGVGALVLFATVQLTMTLGGLFRGERPSARELLGMALALSGLGVLVRPGATAPSAVGVTLMVVAGVGWGLYSLLGRGTKDPLATTRDNFVWALPLAAALLLLRHGQLELAATGVAAAIGSGSVASGIGYALWYAALPGLKATHAAVLQLAVPVIAALLGVLVLGETLTARWASSTALIVSGIGFAVVARRRRAV